MDGIEYKMFVPTAQKLTTLTKLMYIIIMSICIFTKIHQKYNSAISKKISTAIRIFRALILSASWVLLVAPKVCNQIWIERAYKLYKRNWKSAWSKNRFRHKEHINNGRTKMGIGASQSKHSI